MNSLEILVKRDVAMRLQDYALLQSAGRKPNDPMLESLLDYQSFPKTEKWLADARAKILS